MFINVYVSCVCHTFRCVKFNKVHPVLGFGHPMKSAPFLSLKAVAIHRHQTWPQLVLMKRSLNHWIGLRENLQESPKAPYLMGKPMVSS